jgi:hypothetical protein
MYKRVQPDFSACGTPDEGALPRDKANQLSIPVANVMKDAMLKEAMFFTY